MKFLFLLTLVAIMGNRSFAAAHVVDLYDCSSITLDLTVQKVGVGQSEYDPYYQIITSNLADETEIYTMNVESHDLLAEPTNFIGIKKSIETHGILGKGLLLNVNIQGVSLLALDGLIMVMNCQESESN